MVFWRVKDRLLRKASSLACFYAFKLKCAFPFQMFVATGKMRNFAGWEGGEAPPRPSRGREKGRKPIMNCAL